jgi:hypothetical protein
MTTATLNTITKPWWNGPDISWGKKSLLVSVDTSAPRTSDAGNRPSKLPIGLAPRKAANSEPTGGSWLIVPAIWGDSPWDCRPELSAPGNVDDRPMIIMLKKMPMDNEVPALKKVPRMPAAAPRLLAGTLFMIAVVFGDENMPEPMPFSTRSPAKAQ